ncbi:MAG: Bestrophin, RFP-TM, chloride channel-domain-containing protein [Monoraphidium minutum]|nr:MAG: Bestrophin, RFP-TM, chloride channel-domain-containing protein [Monoraphidium minutum]
MPGASPPGSPLPPPPFSPPPPPPADGDGLSLAERLRLTAPSPKTVADPDRFDEFQWYGMANMADANTAGDGGGGGGGQSGGGSGAPVVRRPGTGLRVRLSAADLAAEDERQYRRAVFGFERWAAHRSTSRYMRHLKGIFLSRTLKALVAPLSYFFAVSVAAGLYSQVAAPMYGLPKVFISDSSLEITSFALSLLLVFRTDSSYARWEQALQAWEKVRGECKDLARQACYFVAEPVRKAMLMRWSVAFGHAMLCHVRADATLEEQLAGVLTDEEVEAISAVGPSSAPSFALQVMSEVVEQCSLGEHRAEALHQSLKVLGMQIGACDKLLRYPIPLAYTRHTSRFMFVWLSALPFALYEAGLGWSAVPITLVISYLLLAVDEIGVQVEEPFSILPLEDILFDVQSETSALLARQDAVTDVLRAGGVDCAPRSLAGACHACGAPPGAAAWGGAAPGEGAWGGGGGNGNGGGGYGAAQWPDAAAAGAAAAGEN